MNDLPQRMSIGGGGGKATRWEKKDNEWKPERWKAQKEPLLQRWSEAKE